jgi:hypothetical protein
MSRSLPELLDDCPQFLTLDERSAQDRHFLGEFA